MFPCHMAPTTGARPCYLAVVKRWSWSIGEPSCGTMWQHQVNQPGPTLFNHRENHEKPPPVSTCQPDHSLMRMIINSLVLIDNHLHQWTCAYIITHQTLFLNCSITAIDNGKTHQVLLNEWSNIAILNINYLSVPLKVQCLDKRHTLYKWWPEWRAIRPTWKSLMGNQIKDFFKIKNLCLNTFLKRVLIWMKTEYTRCIYIYLFINSLLWLLTFGFTYRSFNFINIPQLSTTSILTSIKSNFYT